MGLLIIATSRIYQFDDFRFTFFTSRRAWVVGVDAVKIDDSRWLGGTARVSFASGDRVVPHTSNFWVDDDIIPPLLDTFFFLILYYILYVVYVVTEEILEQYRASTVCSTRIYVF